VSGAEKSRNASSYDSLLMVCNEEVLQGVLQNGESDAWTSVTLDS